MTGTKVLLILLVLVVVLFVVLVAWGALKEPSETTWNTFKQDSWYSAVSKLDVFASPPKLKPTALTPHPPPLRRFQPGARVPAGEFILRAGDLPTTFDVSADSDHQVRRGVFSITRQRCAQIEYKSSDPNAGRLKNQPWPHNPYATDNNDEWLDKDDLTKVTLQILSAKGTLTISIQQPDCVV